VGVVILSASVLIFAASMGVLWALGNMDGTDIVAMPAPLVVEEQDYEYEPDLTELIYEPTYTIEEQANPNSNSNSIASDYIVLPWNLTLVNRYNILPDGFRPTTRHVENGHYFDERAADSLLEMLASARSEGLSPMMVSGHRGIDRQRTLFHNQYNRQRDRGLNHEDAFDAARRVVAYPGESEHNLGLAVDIVATNYTSLTASFGQRPEGLWLANNSWRYGFVLRYPYDKQHVTHIIYEPWHFRYVGREHARIMFEHDLVLEEYIALLLTSNEVLRSNTLVNLNGSNAPGAIVDDYRPQEPYVPDETPDYDHNQYEPEYDHNEELLAEEYEE